MSLSLTLLKGPHLIIYQFASLRDKKPLLLVHLVRENLQYLILFQGFMMRIPERCVLTVLTFEALKLHHYSKISPWLVRKLHCSMIQLQQILVMVAPVLHNKKLKWLQLMQRHIHSLQNFPRVIRRS